MTQWKKSGGRSSITREQIFVGVDWSRDHHDVAVIDFHKEVLKQEEVPATGAGIERLGDALLKIVGGHPENVVVGIERPDGILVNRLLARGVVATSANPVDHLLLVGFYLINTGYVTLALRYGTKPNDSVSAIEFFSTKIGLVLLVLGAMHFFNLYIFSRMRRRDGGRDAHLRAPATVA